MDFLKAEIERKKRQLQQNSDLVVPNKKYVKRGDLAARQEAEYWAKHNKLKEDASKHETEETKDESEKSDTKKPEGEKEKLILPRKEVVRFLREFNEPIRLFGESDYEAFERLKKLEASEPDINKGAGYSNDFKAAMDQVDQNYYNEIMQHSSSSAEQSGKVSIKDDGTTVEDIEKMKSVLGKEGSDKDQDIILRFLKYVMKEWGKDINMRSDEEKRSLKGKMASAMHAQTVSYMKPMFRKLKNRTMDSDILECLVSIIGYCLHQDYIKANDAYLEMAIGNAPWPIGVTMVGIHARTGREKISSRYVAHVLNDETQRKYIQGLKRIMTQCQFIFPTDPSHSVNFEPIHH